MPAPVGLCAGVEHARAAHAQEGEGIEVAIIHAGTEVKTRPWAMRVRGILLERPDLLARRDPFTARHTCDDGLVGGEQPVMVSDAHDRFPGNAPRKVHHTVFDCVYVGTTSADVDASVAGTVAVGGWIEARLELW